VRNRERSPAALVDTSVKAPLGIVVDSNVNRRSGESTDVNHRQPSAPETRQFRHRHTPAMVDPVPARRGAVHGGPRHHRRERGAALDRGRARLRASRPPVGRDDLCPVHGRPAAARRPARRPLRSSPGLPHRPVAVHRRVARQRTGAVARRPDRGPCRAGDRCGAPHPRGALDRHHHLHGLAAHQGAQRMGGDRQRRRRGRRVVWRRAHHRARLGMGLPRQRPGWNRRAGADPAAHPCRQAGRRRGQARPAGRRDRRGRADGARLRPRRDLGPRLGLGAHAAPACAGRRPSGGLRPRRAREPAATAAAGDLVPPVARLERGGGARHKRGSSWARSS
jgi:hypothetical protein